MTIDPILTEYRDNPFIACLPPPLSVSEALAKLTDLPSYSEAERQYPAHLRCHCIQRLGRYFDPLSRHLSLEQRIGTLIRQGYVGRNPNTTDYLHRLHNNHERVRRRDLGAQIHPVETTASGFSLIGWSGIGKSRSVDRILRLYPQTIEHADPVALVQVAWLKLDCPYKGSAKQLCISFFHEMDRLLGTRFQARHGSGRTALDEMVVHMAEIADRQALGLLVIDEIQHLMQAPGSGRDDLLNFLVTLINRIGLPVMIVGTPAALPLLQGAFRQARRASGAGSAVWEAMREDGDWDAFLARMWSFQWTREKTPLTPEIVAVLRDESQGIVDVVIKLYMLVQLRAIQLGELAGRPERIDPGLIRHVARTELKLIAPMIDALRRGDDRALQRYDDLTALANVVESSLHDATLRLQPRINTVVPTAAPVVSVGGQEEMSLLSMLESMGIAGDIAAVLVTEVRAANPEASTLDLVTAVCDRIRQRGPDPKLTAPRPKRPAKSDKIPSPGDLRPITLEREDAYERLKAAGWIRAPLDDVA